MTKQKTAATDAQRQGWQLIFQTRSKSHYACVLRDSVSGAHSIAVMRRHARKWLSVTQIFPPEISPADALPQVARLIDMPDAIVLEMSLRMHAGIVPAE
jgi:hypothetical protein